MAMVEAVEIVEIVDAVDAVEAVEAVEVGEWIGERGEKKTPKVPILFSWSERLELSERGVLVVGKWPHLNCTFIRNISRTRCWCC